MANFALDIADVRFRWPRGPEVLALPALTLAQGESLFLRGPSGSGKSTLLSLIAGIVTPDSGRVAVLDRDLGGVSAARRDAFRADRLGVIFQMFNLLPYLSAAENAALPCRFSRRRAEAAAGKGGPKREARRLLQRLGVDPTLFARKPHRLSVGQQQRVAAARALIGAPELILADEPTSALDSDARDAFIALLLEECAASGASLVFVSHDAGLAARFDRALDLAAINRAAGGAGP